jgi:hypothetical protein
MMNEAEERDMVARYLKEGDMPNYMTPQVTNAIFTVLVEEFGVSDFFRSFFVAKFPDVEPEYKFKGGRLTFEPALKSYRILDVYQELECPNVYVTSRNVHARHHANMKIMAIVRIAHLPSGHAKKPGW